MPQLKPGTRLRSAVCASEVMVVAAPKEGAELTCGGVAMLELGGEPPASATLSPDASAGTAMGKRYVNQAGDLEVLCTKPGEGSLGSGAEALKVKGAKPLPSSD
jgi:hypothetical protein